MSKVVVPLQRRTRVRLTVVSIVALMVCSLGVVSTERSSNLRARVAASRPEMLRLVRTVQVAPDARFPNPGWFVRVNHVPATNRLVVTFASAPASSEPDQQSGYAYKEYDMGMNETGSAGYFLRAPASDSGSIMIGNTYYFAWSSSFYGWQITKYDAVTWQVLGEMSVPLDEATEASNDPMVAYVDGHLDVSSQANPPPGLDEGTSTHHRFFSLDLVAEGQMVLANPPHICGSSMVYVDGVYHLVTGTAFLGDLFVMQYDRDWNLIQEKWLRPHAHWSQGLAFDGQRFYVAYLDTSRRPPTLFPLVTNLHLAVFDRDWNLLDDVAITDFHIEDLAFAGRPWVIIRNSRAYVSYDVSTVDPVTGHEDGRSRSYVSVCNVRALGASGRN